MSAAGTATRRAPIDAQSSAHRAGRSYVTASTRASTASRRAWSVYRLSASTTTASPETRNRPEWPATFSSPSPSATPVR